MKQKALGDTLIDASNPESDAVALAKQNPAYSSFHSDLDSLAGTMRDDESLRLLAQGMSGRTPVLLALTDQRVLLHADSATAKVRESVPLPAHASWNSSLISSVLTVRSGPHELKVGAISDAVADRFLDALS